VHRAFWTSAATGGERAGLDQKCPTCVILPPLRFVVNGERGSCDLMSRPWLLRFPATRCRAFCWRERKAAVNPPRLRKHGTWLFHRPVRNSTSALAEPVETRGRAMILEKFAAKPNATKRGRQRQHSAYLGRSAFMAAPQFMQCSGSARRSKPNRIDERLQPPGGPRFERGCIDRASLKVCPAVPERFVTVVF